MGEPDRLVDELRRAQVGGPARLQKVRYTHADIIDFMIANPTVSQGELALRYGYTPGWISTVLASDAFQAAFAKRKAEVTNPALVASVDERFRAITIQSLSRLAEELEKPACKPEVMLRAAELGAKSLGLGGNAPPAPPAGDSLVRLADRLIALQSHIRQGLPNEEQRVLEPRIIEGVRIDAGQDRPDPEDIPRQAAGERESQ